ncbi:MAG: T9SS type A sorting domain-containing protein [Bacteroidales bacterium]|nr:T9SS type A sorting domain-containing protein [Bacteroidales bacterium]
MRKAMLILSILFSVFSNAQIPEITWQQCFGSGEPDKGYGVVEKSDGLLFAIHIGDSTQGVTNYHGLGDIWIVNTDSLGNILWEKCYGGSSGDVPQKLVKKSENEYFIFGYTYSTDGDVQSGNNGYSDIWVVNIEGQGTIQWEKTYGCTGIDDPRDLILTPDNGFVFIDRIGIGGGDVSNFYGVGDVWMCKCDSLGNIEWEKTLGNDGLDNCISMIINSEGNIMMIGATQKHGGLVECYPDEAWGDVWLVELDLQGNIISQHCYGGSHYDLGYTILELNEGYVMIASVTSNDGDVTGLHGPPGGPPDGHSDIWIVKLDEQLDIIWQNCIGGYESDTPKYITETEDGGYLVVGNTISNSGDVSGNHSLAGVYTDIWVVKLNHSGEIEWQQCYGGWGREKLESPHTILKKGDYNYVIAATTNYGPSYDVACTPTGGNETDKDAWIFEIDMEDTTNIIGKPAMEDRIKVYPNPARDYVVFELDIQGLNIKTLDNKGELKIKNVFGQEVSKISFNSETTIWDIKGIKSGIYFYSTFINKKNISGKIIIE